MVKAKKELFDRELQEVARFFRCLGHPARLAILQYLSSTETCIMGDISDELPLSRTTVNQHLKALKELGVIKGEVEGVRVNYCLNGEVLEGLKKMGFHFLDSIHSCSASDCS
jgi:ArsR family transcriptional regulator, arsenate/arsenite/antimonite-responsive transcriptional repressor